MSMCSDLAPGILKIDVSREGGVVRFALAGELDLATAGAVREKFAKAKGEGASRVVIDLRELTFIDSTGIALLLSAVKEDDEGRLSFVPCTAPSVQRVLRVTGVAEIFGGGEALTDEARL